MSNNKRARHSPTRMCQENRDDGEGGPNVSLRLDSGSVSFVSGASQFLLPSIRAHRSELIADLLEQSDGCQKNLPTPLSLVEVWSWLATSALSSCNNDESPPQAETMMLLQALKVCTICLTVFIDCAFGIICRRQSGPHAFF